MFLPPLPRPLVQVEGGTSSSLFGESRLDLFDSGSKEDTSDLLFLFGRGEDELSCKEGRFSSVGEEGEMVGDGTELASGLEGNASLPSESVS